MHDATSFCVFYTYTCFIYLLVLMEINFLSLQRHLNLGPSLEELKENEQHSKKNLYISRGFESSLLEERHDQPGTPIMLY